METRKTVRVSIVDGEPVEDPDGDFVLASDFIREREKGRALYAQGYHDATMEIHRIVFPDNLDGVWYKVIENDVPTLVNYGKFEKQKKLITDYNNKYGEKE